MTENPYQPPSKTAPSEASGPRWYETQPADWEATAAVSWLAGAAVLLWNGFAPMMFQAAESPTLPLIPGPQVIGGLAYTGLALVLAILPAILWAGLHMAAMQLSSQTFFRWSLAWIAKLMGVGLSAIAAAACQLVLIR